MVNDRYSLIFSLRDIFRNNQLIFIVEMITSLKVNEQRNDLCFIFHSVARSSVANHFQFHEKESSLFSIHHNYIEERSAFFSKLQRDD